MNFVDKKEHESAIDRLDRHLNMVEQKLQKEISEVKVDIIKWVVAIAFAQSAFIFSTIKFLH
jgi:hypothetical protein